MSIGTVAQRKGTQSSAAEISNASRFPPEAVLQRFAGQHFLYGVGGIICFEKCDDPHDLTSSAGTRESRQQPCLAQEPLTAVFENLSVRFNRNCLGRASSKLPGKELFDSKELPEQIDGAIGDAKATTPPRPHRYGIR
jgi:hypothetical protein